MGFAMLFVVIGVVSCVGADTIIAYNNTTRESLSAEEWCGCMNGTELLDVYRHMIMHECLLKFDVFHLFKGQAGDLYHYNCTEFFSRHPNASPASESVILQQESNTTDDKLDLESHAVLPTVASANKNVTLHPSATTFNDTNAESSEKPIAETEADGCSHLYWTLALIVFLIAMLTGGILIYRYINKGGYLQQPPKSTVQGDCSVLYCKMQV